MRFHVVEVASKTKGRDNEFIVTDEALGPLFSSRQPIVVAATKQFAENCAASLNAGGGPFDWLRLEPPSNDYKVAPSMEVPQIAGARRRSSSAKEKAGR
jgi:hypothetical protein